MKITPLSAARITGEVGLAGGTITGGTVAAKYGSQVASLTKNKDKKDVNLDSDDDVWKHINHMPSLIKLFEQKHQNLKEDTEWQSIKHAFEEVDKKLKQQ